MTTVLETEIEAASHPLDLIEDVVSANEWPFDRPAEDELLAEVNGRFCDLRLFFVWREDFNAIHFTCAFDARVPPHHRREIHELLAMVNEKLWLGHFELASEDGAPLFRHTLPLRGVSGPAVEQIEDMLETALSECDRFFPAFQFVNWGGKTAEEAFKAAMFETMGEA